MLVIGSSKLYMNIVFFSIKCSSLNLICVSNLNGYSFTLLIVSKIEILALRIILRIP